MKETQPLDRAEGFPQCVSCGAAIVWFITKNLKRMPVDASSVDPADTKLDLKKHISHFATCPNAAKHRRAR